MAWARSVLYASLFQKCATIRAMVTKKEVRFLHLLFASWIVLMAFALITTSVSIMEIWQTNSMNDNIFELVFMACHFIFLGFLIMITLNAFKKGSYIIRTLAYGAYEGVSLFYRVLSILILIIGIALTVFGILFLTPAGIRDFGFTVTLKWAMVNAGLTVVVLSIAFLLFPILFAKNPTLTKQKENELNEGKKQI